MIDFICFSPVIFFIILTLFLLVLSSFFVFVDNVAAYLYMPFFFKYISFFCFFLLLNIRVLEAIIFNNHFNCTSLSITVALFVICLVFFLQFVLGLYCKNQVISALEPFILYALVFVGSYFIIMACDFFALYLALELVTITSFILACLQKFSSFASEASLKYFILGAMSSGLLLFGITMIYGFTGLSNFFDFKFLFESGLILFSTEGFALFTGFVFLLAGFFFKLSVAPFHMWIPDVFEGVSPPVVLLFGSVSKIIVVLALFNLLWGVFYDFFFLWSFLLIFFGLISVLWGSIGGLLQVKLFRILAYSAIVNGGFFSLLLSVGSFDSFVSLFNYLFIYALTLFFLFVLLTGSNFIKFNVRTVFVYLEEFFLFGKTFKIESFLFALVFFSFIGIPPLAGFFGKFFFFLSMFNEGSYFFVLFFLFFCTVLSTVYYIKCVHFLYFKTDIGFLNLQIQGTALYNIIVSFFFIVTLFVLIQPMVLHCLNTVIIGFFL